ncbi:PadR family transcriptional regulator [Bacillus lacus]|uniref:PadR family transcriptional regulator n=1 Tax=Metabacillus lacus TaxID=1983721 RepID=A0A7X2M147_9BACI|nr:PadR family transcriptional regulator [Metabacillus lacus]MRX74197.1 PadR family transcriptional regulator [Metabacillus lacus]
MEDRLRGLKASLRNTAFNGLEFTDYHRKKINREIKKQAERDEDILLAVLQLLTVEKSGYELASQLRSRGITKFEDHEGFLYSLLHKLENKHILQADWKENAKLYTLNNKGRKLLTKAEKENKRHRFSLHELLEGGS